MTTTWYVNVVLRSITKTDAQTTLMYFINRFSCFKNEAKMVGSHNKMLPLHFCFYIFRNKRLFTFSVIQIASSITSTHFITFIIMSLIYKIHHKLFLLSPYIPPPEHYQKNSPHLALPLLFLFPINSVYKFDSRYCSTYNFPL